LRKDAGRVRASFPIGRPLDASLDGYRSDLLFSITTVMCAVLFLLMSGIILWACIAYRQGIHRAHYEQGVGRRALLLTATITAIIFFGVDGVLLFDSYLDLDLAFWNFPSGAARPLDIEIYAQQWAWNIRYAGPDGRFNTADDVVTLDELHIPVGRPVVVKLRSKDVVHSFYLPNFRIKQDAIPGRETKLWFQAKRAGRYEIACAQHCGASHYKMRGLVTAEAPAEFEAWLRTRSSEDARRFDEADRDAHWGWPWGT
jgi:cytochrome c oxidase subunit 2